MTEPDDGREWVPVSAMMTALAVCEVPTDDAMEILRLARKIRDAMTANAA